MTSGLRPPASGFGRRSDGVVWTPHLATSALRGETVVRTEQGARPDREAHLAGEPGGALLPHVRSAALAASGASAEARRATRRERRPLPRGAPSPVPALPFPVLLVSSGGVGVCRGGMSASRPRSCGLLIRSDAKARHRAAQPLPQHPGATSTATPWPYSAVRRSPPPPVPCSTARTLQRPARRRPPTRNAPPGARSPRRADLCPSPAPSPSS